MPPLPRAPGASPGDATLYAPYWHLKGAIAVGRGGGVRAWARGWGPPLMRFWAWAPEGGGPPPHLPPLPRTPGAFPGDATLQALHWHLVGAIAVGRGARGRGGARARGSQGNVCASGHTGPAGPRCTSPPWLWAHASCMSLRLQHTAASVLAPATRGAARLGGLGLPRGGVAPHRTCCFLCVWEGVTVRDGIPPPPSLPYGLSGGVSIHY